MTMKLQSYTKNVTRLTQLAFIALATFGLHACGGGDDPAPAPTPVPVTSPPIAADVRIGVFLDGPVKGLTYSTPTRNGVTNDKGEFQYLPGESVSFSLGKLVLGAAPGAATIVPNDVVGEPRDEIGLKTTKLLKLLVNLDKDSAPSNGIEIDAAIAARALAPQFDTTLAEVGFDRMQDLIVDLTGKPADQLKSDLDALEHFLDTLKRFNLPYPFGDSTARLLAFNDFHGNLLPTDSGQVTVTDPADATKTLRVNAGGAAFLATKIKELRSTRRNTVVISTGDAIGASPLVSALFRDEPTIEVFNEMGVDVNVLGNHEFDKGKDELMRIIKGGCAQAGGDPNLSTCTNEKGKYKGANFPFIAANVVDEKTNRPIVRPFIVRVMNGVPVAFVGAVTRTTPTIVVPTGVSGLKFTDEADAINEQVTLLKRRGINAFVALVHEGGVTDSTYNNPTCANARGSIFEIADRLDKAVDVVFSAHTHQAYNCVRNGINVIQGSAFGRLVSEVEFKLDFLSRDVVKSTIKATNIAVPNDLNTDPAIVAKFPPLKADEAVAKIVKYYSDLAAPKINRPVGKITATVDRTASTGGDHAAGRLIADAQLAATSVAVLGEAVVAFMNPGGVRADFVFVAPDGNITFGDAFRVQPFGNSLVTMTLTGQQIKDLLEQQWTGANATRARILQPSKSFSYSWSNSAVAGNKVDAASMRINGQVVSLVQNYRVTVNSFLAEGGDGFTLLISGTNRLGGALDIDALIDFFKLKSPIAPDITSRITRTN
jgi:5'-nucleotidase